MTAIGLFGRSVAVEFGPAGGPGLRIADLRVSFKVTYKASKGPNTGTIKIYNPAPTTVGLLQTPGTTIRLLAGYGGLPRLLFAGDPVKGGVSYQAEGADRVLEVDAADGGRAFTATHLAISFATPTTFGQVLTAILGQTLWARGYVDPSIESVQLPHGIVLLGRPAEVLDRLAASVPPAGADWFVRDGAVYLVGRGSSSPEVAPLLSATQGNLIGSAIGVKIAGAGGKAPINNNGLRVKALIDATMRPGRSYVVEALGASGVYVARDVTFTGDSGFDRAFYMEIDGKPVGVP